MNTSSIIGNLQAGTTLNGSVSGASALGSVTIRGVTIQRVDGAKIYVDTTANWNLQTTYVPESGAIIVYTDHTTIEDDVGNVKYVPGVKIGDGNAYVVDLPFIDDATLDMLLEHINDTTVHVTAAERTFWNNKLNYEMSGETLTFNRS